MATRKLRATNIIQSVRRMLAQVTDDDEDVRTDSSIFGSNNTNFSNEDLIDRINLGQRDIVKRVKAMHVPEAVVRYDTAAGDNLPTPEIEYARLLYGRVLYTGAAGDPSNNAPYDPQGYFDGQPTYPEIVYQLIANRVIYVTDIALDTGTNPSVAHSLLVTVDGNAVATIAVNTSGTHVTTITGGTFTIQTGEIMQITVASVGFDAADLTFGFTATAEVFSSDTVEGQRCRQRSVDRHRRLQRTDVGDTPGRVASGVYPTYTFEDGELVVSPDSDSVTAFFVGMPDTITMDDYDNSTDYLIIDERLEMALTAWVCASCLQTDKNVAGSQLYYQLYEDEIVPYSIEHRLNSLIDDREVDVE